jgi:hypothetical protein
MHPDNKNYREIRLNHLNEEVLGMLECRKRAIDMKAEQAIVLPVPMKDCDILDE